MLRSPTLVILSQVYVPDPAAVGQYLTDVASAMVRRGHRVKVYTSTRGYDDPTRQYPTRQKLDGVEIRRLNFTSFGKKRPLLRVIGTLSFMLQVFLRLLSEPRLSGIFFSTSPPMIGFAACLAGWVRRVPVAYWVMDLNPDQLIALKKIRSDSWAARMLARVNQFILDRSKLVIALDPYMAKRLERRTHLNGRLLVLPPWPMERQLIPPASIAPQLDGRCLNPFRRRHGLEGKFLVMYSGNHTTSNPLTTLLETALACRDRSDICFAFVGGGNAKRGVERFVDEHGLKNVLLLPYQPLEDLAISLAAADLQVASLGDEMVGIIHPCKVYGAMAAGRPLLYFGPEASHIGDLLKRYDIGWHVSHGDVRGAVTLLDRISHMPDSALHDMGSRAREIAHEQLNQNVLCGRLCERVEQSLRLN